MSVFKKQKSENMISIRKLRFYNEGKELIVHVRDEKEVIDSY